MLKPHPQPIPQERPAVPLPLDVMVAMVKVCAAREESPHWPWVTSVPVPTPEVFKVTPICMVAAPQPVVPRRAIFHLPARSAFVMLPMLAELVVLRLTMVVKASTLNATRRADTLWFFMTFSLNGLRIDGSIRFARQTSPRGNKSGATWTNAKLTSG